MKNISFLFIALFFCACSSKMNNKNMIYYGNGESSLEVEISPADFFQINKNKALTDEEIIIFFDSLIPNNLDLLHEICYHEDDADFSDNLRNICSIYRIYLSLCNKDFDSAKEQIEKINPHYQFDKFASFYFWSVKNYEAANWYSEFYLFKYHNEKKRTFRWSGSKIKFEIKFLNDPSFRYLKKVLD